MIVIILAISIIILVIEIIRELKIKKKYTREIYGQVKYIEETPSKVGRYRIVVEVQESLEAINKTSLLVHGYRIGDLIKVKVNPKDLKDMIIKEDEEFIKRRLKQSVACVIINIVFMVIIKSI